MLLAFVSVRPATPNSAPVSRLSYSRALVTASVDVCGGGPGTRETALLDPAQTVEGIDAIVLSGGSAFGLDAASGVQAWLREQGRGFHVRDARVPIVPGAILFDLLSGGDKNWGRYPPTASSGTKRQKTPVPIFRLEALARGLAPQPPTSRVASVQPARARAMGLLSVRLPQPTLRKHDNWRHPRISGPPHSSRTVNSVVAAGQDRCLPTL